MNKKRKITLIALAIASAAFLSIFVVLFFTFGFFSGDPSVGAVFNETHLELIKGLFVYPFDKAGGALLAIAYGEGGALALSISALVLLGAIVVATALGIVLVCLKKKPLMIIFAPAMLLAGFTGLAMLATGGCFFDYIKLYSEFNQGGIVVLCLFVLILAILGFIVTIFTYIFGLISISAKAKDEEEQKEEIEVVAEENADPEAVEEGTLLAFPVPELDAAPIPEPEPIPEEVEVEPIPVEEPKVEPEPSHVEVNVNAAPTQTGIDQNSLASLLREVVRDIVRDEIARNNANQPQQPQQQQPSQQTITGATFGGPLVVQYFNGGINGVNPAPNVVPAPAPAPAPAPEPVKEEVKPEPAPVKEEPKVEEVKPEPIPEPVPAPQVEAKPAPLFTKKEQPADAAPEAPKYERLTFAERLLKSEKDVQDLYNEIKNEILSYGVKSRISANGDTFRLHKKMYVRITVAGKSLKLYFALNPADYANSTIPVQDASNKDMYVDIPLVFKVKSGLSVRRCKDLIQDVMEKDGLEQGEVGKVNWIKELKAELANDKKKAKEAE